MASINLQGDTSGSISIQAPSVAGSNTITLPATTQTLATQNALGVRNLIINGDMNIAQRGTSATGLVSGNNFLIDRWLFNLDTTGTWTQEQDTDVPSGQGFASSLKLSCTTANASIAGTKWMNLQHRLEAQFLQHLKWGTASAESLTLTFWVKSNKTGTYTLSIYKSEGTAYGISKEYTIDTADTWEKKTIAIDAHTIDVIVNDNGNGFNMYWVLDSGPDRKSSSLQTSWGVYDSTAFVSSSQATLADNTSNYINITGVQLEVGDTATPFEHRPYDMELQRCQRYCTVISGEGSSASYSAFGYGFNSSGTRHECICYLPTKMRATPSLTATASEWQISSVTTAPTATSINIFSNQSSTNSVQVYADTSGLTQAYPGRLETKGSTTAKAILSAEL